VRVQVPANGIVLHDDAPACEFMQTPSGISNYMRLGPILLLSSSLAGELSTETILANIFDLVNMALTGSRAP
jgi:hypothetical protein